MSTTIAGLSLIVATDEQVDQIAALLRELGLDASGDAGYVTVQGLSTPLSVMRGALVPTADLGGVLLQLSVADLDDALAAAGRAGATVAAAPTQTEFGTRSAFVQLLGLTIELIHEPN